jgi:MFS family permease
MAIEAQDIGLLKNPRFRRLLESRILGQAAWNAMIYGLLILVVEDSGSSVQSTFLIVAMTLPSILFGIPGGALADMLPLRFSLTMGYLMRAAVALVLIFYRDDLLYIYLLVFAASTVGQVFTPAEAATVPAVVKKKQLPAANSLMVLTLIMGQIIGAVTLAPLLWKIFGGPIPILIICMMFFLAAGYVIGWMASGYGSSKPEADRPSMPFIDAMREGFRILRTVRQAYLAILYLVIAGAMGKMLIILLPKYTEDVLEISAEDTVFVAAPAAIGAGLGLAMAPTAARWFGSWRVVAFGFAVLMASLIGLGLVVYVRDFIQNNFDFGLTFLDEEAGLDSVVTVTMLLAMPAGFAFTLVAVAARVVMNEQAPQEAQGRVFAVQMAVGDFVALLPLLLVGVVADVVGVRATLLAASISAVGVASYLTFSSRFGPPGGRAPPLAQVGPTTGQSHTSNTDNAPD